jgi:hypothetical protein
MPGRDLRGMRKALCAIVLTFDKAGKLVTTLCF